MERRLAAILAADVVDYSTMTGTDEARALASVGTPQCVEVNTTKAQRREAHTDHLN